MQIDRDTNRLLGKIKQVQLRDVGIWTRRECEVSLDSARRRNLRRHRSERLVSLSSE